jgi:signal transduction histidine kinase
VGITVYAQRLTNAQREKAEIEDSLLAARRLEEWNQMSAVVTHEINNPLAAIQNFMFLIERNPLASDDIRFLAEQAAEEVRRIGAITRSTLGFFREDQQPEKTDILVSAESVHFLLEPLLRQRGVELVIQSAGDCAVTAYSMEIRQVLLNLVRNACEATTHRGAKVRIGIEGRRDDVLVAVEDQGGGIPPELLQNIFQFGVSTKGERGNGMGLWAVKKLIVRHGGTIDVESAVGKGSMFTIRWPRQVPTEELSEVSSAAAQAWYPVA